MSDGWVLWGRIEQTGPNEWAALASALHERAPASCPKVKIHTKETRLAAEACLKDMLTDLGEEIRAAGGRITDVETDGV